MAPAARRLIVNADDFGLAACINRGIVRAHSEGILTSATLLANLSGFNDAVERARSCPHLGIGVHLNLMRGAPLTDPASLRPLLADGRFRPDLRRLRAAIRRPTILPAATDEYRAQIERVLMAGLRPTHLDTEKHHGLWRRLGEAILRLADEYGLAVRNLEEPVTWSVAHLPWPGFAAVRQAALLRTYVTLFGASNPERRGRNVSRETFDRQNAGRDSTPPDPTPSFDAAPNVSRETFAGRIRTPDRLLGQVHIGQMTTPVWLKLLAACPAGASEVMVHPGEIDPAELAALPSDIGASRLHAGRAAELAALCDPTVRSAAAAAGVEFIHFGEL